MSIRIGNNNKIKNSTIGHRYGSKESTEKFYERHPIISSIVISLVTGFILLFSFWGSIISWIENLFN